MVCKTIANTQLLFPFLTYAKDGTRPAHGVLLVDLSFGENEVQPRTLQERQHRLDVVLEAVERMKISNTARHLHRLCVSTVHVVK